MMINRFTQPLEVRKLDKGRYLLLTTFRYHVGSKNSDEIIEVPAGFISDGASIPKFLWSIVGHPMDSYAQSAFLHDFICRYKREKYNRKQGELIMLESMVAIKVPLWKRRIIYYGLRIFGWIMYNRKINNNKPPRGTPDLKPAQKRKSNP